MSDALQTDLNVHLPRGTTGLDQDAEWCIVETDGDRRRVLFHDYAQLYQTPGLYEGLFYDALECDSPQVVCGLLREAMLEQDRDIRDLSVLDVGAGNGMVGEVLAEMGASNLVGVDIIEEALEATERDRPEVYDDYRVVDLTDVSPEDDAALRDHGFNAMVTVAALGFGDIPPEAFAQAYDYVEDGGLIVFNIKDRFLESGDPSGFRKLVNGLADEGLLKPLAQRRYRHRLSMTGKPLHYFAHVCEKRGPVPAHWL